MDVKTRNERPDLVLLTERSYGMEPLYGGNWVKISQGSDVIVLSKRQMYLVREQMGDILRQSNLKQNQKKADK